MGVDCNFFVRPEIGPEEIMVGLRALGKKNVEWKSSVAPHYVNILFDSKEKDRKRSINFFFNRREDYFGMTCNYLSLGANEEAVELFRQLASMFGGVLQESDCTNDCEMFRTPGGGNIRWMLERFFAKNPDCPEESDAQVEELINFIKKGDFS